MHTVNCLSVLIDICDNFSWVSSQLRNENVCPSIGYKMDYVSFYMKVSSEYPAYILATPTVADLILDHVGLELTIGTSAGHLHLIDHQGQSMQPFPLPTESIQTQVNLIPITIPAGSNSL